MNSELKEEIKNTVVKIHPSRFAYLQSSNTQNDSYFLATKDNDEITFIVEEKNIEKFDFQKINKWFKLIEFKITKPFLCVGFLAAVSKTISEKGMNILIVSTFSKDYILIKEEELEKAREALKETGFAI
ncbi:MAG: ACT domain-containing protein [archaeon]|nr:ACT domain-containing protein [archaeon]